MTAKSSNTNLAPLAGIAFAGAGSNRTVTVAPVAGRDGEAVIRVAVSDGLLSTNAAFILGVYDTNAAANGFMRPRGMFVLSGAGGTKHVRADGVTNYLRDDNILTNSFVDGYTLRVPWGESRVMRRSPLKG